MRECVTPGTGEGVVSESQDLRGRAGKEGGTERVLRAQGAREPVMAGELDEWVMKQEHVRP